MQFFLKIKLQISVETDGISVGNELILSLEVSVLPASFMARELGAALSQGVFCYPFLTITSC